MNPTDPARVYVRGSAAAEAIEWGLWLALTVWWIVDLALSPFQLVLMGVVVNVAVILSETPTGVVADLYSRRRSLIIAEFVMAAAFVWAFASRNYWVILPAQALFAFGWTFRSGADIAWVTDELRGRYPGPANTAKTDDDAIERLILRQHAVGILWSMVAVVAVMFVGSWSLRAAGLLCAVGKCLVGLYYLRRMTEEHFTPQSDSSTFRETLTEGTRVIGRTPRLKVALATMMIAGFSSEIFDRLGFAHFIESSIDAGFDASVIDDPSLVSTGVLFLIMGVAGVTVNRIAQRSLDRKRGVVMVTMVLLIVAGIGGLIAATTGLLVLLGIGLTMQDSTRESLHSVFGSWINRDAPTEVRATVHSLTGQGLAVSEIAGGVALGLLAERAGLRVVLAVAAVLMLVAGGVALRARSMEPVIYAPDN